MSKCKFYELDAVTEAEATAMAKAYADIFSDEEIPDIQCEPSPLDDCGFCKHLRHGKGYPGEYVYNCSAVGNEHILHADFNESEIILPTVIN